LKIPVKMLMSESSGSLLPVLWSIGISTFFLTGCISKEPVRIGFVAQLTGVQAELGVQERNGVRLAVEEINAAGGVARRRIALIVRDDLGTPEGAKAADSELIKAGVTAVIGHATSGVTLAGLAVTNPAHVVMLSPSASTTELSGRDDYFFRIAQTTETRSVLFARHVYKKRVIKRLAVIYDTDNIAYSNSYMKTFAVEYRALGGEVVEEACFSSKAQPDLAPLLAKLRARNPVGLFIIAADIDTALIAQRTRLMGWRIPLFTTSWAQTDTLINNGGRAVEGLEIELSETLDAPTPAYSAFKTRYQTRFGRHPAFGASLGYEAAKVLAVALQKTGGKAEGLRQALLGIRNFKELIDTISFDKYGDVARPAFIGVIHSDKYVNVEP
jgi:branched-chain amino acid transport system substrate-binding protein